MGMHLKDLQGNSGEGVQASSSASIRSSNANRINPQRCDNTARYCDQSHSRASARSHPFCAPSNGRTPPTPLRSNVNRFVDQQDNAYVPIRRPDGLPSDRNDWQSWPSLEVVMSGKALGERPRAVDFLPIFNKFGRVRKISKENKDDKEFDLKVEYSPPPSQPFWKTWNYNDFKLEVVKVCSPRHAFGDVKLPSNSSTRAKFKSEVFPAKSLTIGQMKNEDVFVKEWWTSNISTVEFTFNFADRRFETELSHQFQLDDHSVKEEMYKFQYEFRNVSVCLEGLHTMRPTIIFKAETPADFWRRRANPVREEDEDPNQARDTYEERLYWNRATVMRTKREVAKGEERRQRQPVGVMIKDELPYCINFGKWRVYRIQFDFGRNGSQWAVFQEAVKFLRLFTDMNLAPYKHTELKHQPPPFSYKHLPFELVYMIECLISKDILSEYNLTQSFVEMVESVEISAALNVLELMHDGGKPMYKPLERLQEELNRLRTSNIRGFRRLNPPGHCLYTRRAEVTPTRIILHPPTLEETNRVTRHFKNQIDYFLRITFSDESNRLRFNEDKSMDALYTRVFDVLREGLQIGDRKYELLSASSSQLKDHGCWFYASKAHPSCDDIRKWMGDFVQCKTPAKLLARMGQAFSSTKPVLQIDNIVKIPDIEINIDDRIYCFTDGVGKIGRKVVQICHQKIDDTREQPIAFQIRMGGCKGVLAYWPDVPDDEVHVRTSQEKFNSEHTMLEVVRGSSYKTAFLSRQVITVLNSALGIPNKVFKDIQDAEVEKLSGIDTNRDAAFRFLTNDVDVFTGAREMLRQAVACGFLDHGDIVITNIMRLLKAWRLRNIKSKARIPIPDGAYLLGIIDETGILDENEIFVQIKLTGFRDVIGGKCIIYRNPCIHPGDVRVVMAKDDKATVDKLGHLYNVVVFPQRGKRDLASQCGGGDLDGDDYTVIWDERLIPPKGHVEPMDYDAPRPPAPGVSQKITMWAVSRFMTNYFKDNNLGTIANNYLAIADDSPMGSRDSRCIELAQLHSQAVDFAKTGVSAKLPRRLKTSNRPDFMEPPHLRPYQSTRALGVMYRAINLVTYKPEISQDHMDRRIRAKLELEASADEIQQGVGWDPAVTKWISAARDLKQEYDRELAKLQNRYDIGTEYEIIASVIVADDSTDGGTASRARKKVAHIDKKDWDLREEIHRLYSEIRIDMRQKILKMVMGDQALFGEQDGFGDWDDETLEKPDFLGTELSQLPELPKRKGVAPLTELEKRLLVPFVIAMYRVTYGPQKQLRAKQANEPSLEEEFVRSHERFTFPWIFHEILCSIVRLGVHEQRRRAEDAKRPSPLQRMATVAIGKKEERVRIAANAMVGEEDFISPPPVVPTVGNLIDLVEVIELERDASDGEEVQPNFY